MIKRFVTAALLLFPFLHQDTALAQMRAIQRLEGVYVMGEVSGNGAEAMYRRDILETVEADLRLAGIRVLTEEEWIQVEGSPVLYVEVVLTQQNEHEVRSDTRISLQQLSDTESGKYRVLWNRTVSTRAQTASLDTLKHTVSSLMANMLAACKPGCTPHEPK